MPGAFKTKIILVVDDDPATGELMKEIFSEAPGYLALVTGDGEHALHLMRKIRIDLALIDIQMPNLSGFELLDRMAQDPTLSKLNVLVLTAGRHKAELEARGIKQWLEKPFDVDDLLTRVSIALSDPTRIAR